MSTTYYHLHPAPPWMRSIGSNNSGTISTSNWHSAVVRGTNFAGSTPIPINSTVGSHGYWGFSSDHEGGAQFCLADGAVRFLSENIDQTLYENLSTMQDGNVVGEF